jgi:outer membrane protein, multidrug efflux system
MASFLLLSACAAPKAAVPPEAGVRAPIAWRGGASTAIELEAGWWRGFGDPVLSRIVEVALNDNEDIAIAAGRVAEARAQFRLSRAEMFPNIGSGAEIDRSRSINPGFGVPEIQTDGGDQIEISYDLDLFGRLADSAKSAQAGLLATEAEQDNIRLAVASSAANGYITLRGLDAQLLVLRDTLSARARSCVLRDADPIPVTVASSILPRQKPLTTLPNS